MKGLPRHWAGLEQYILLPSLANFSSRSRAKRSRKKTCEACRIRLVVFQTWSVVYNTVAKVVLKPTWGGVQLLLASLEANEQCHEAPVSGCESSRRPCRAGWSSPSPSNCDGSDGHTPGLTWRRACFCVSEKKHCSRPFSRIHH